MLRVWTEDLPAELQELGIRIFPTETSFFLADFAPYNADDLAERLQERGIYIKLLKDPVLGPGYMRVTTALPEDNDYFIRVLWELL